MKLASKIKIHFETNNPTQKLEVNGGNIRCSDGEIWCTNSDIARFVIGDSNYRFFELKTNDSPDYLHIRAYTGDTDLMSIHHQGNVGIGITTPSYKLDVAGNVASNYVARFYNAGDNANRYGIAIQAGANDGSGTTYFLTARDGNGTVTGYLRTIDGTFSCVDTSDERLKCNIEDAQINGIEAISGLRVRKFNWKKNPDGPKVTGLIAQELQEIYPEAVSEGDDGMLGISKEALVMPLVKAVQEQQIIIEDLISRIESLEGS